MERTEWQGPENDHPTSEQTGSKNIDPKNNKKLTHNQLKKFPKLAEISDAESTEITEFINELANLLYDIYSQRKSHSNEL